MRIGLAAVVAIMMTGTVFNPGRAAPLEKTAAAGQPQRVLIPQNVVVEDTLWSGDVRVEGGVTVAPHATLTVAAGTVVRFAPANDSQSQSLPALMVQGRLVVNGTPEQPVLFDGIGNGASAGAVSWQGILLVGSEKNNMLSNTRIKGAKVGIDALFSRLVLKSVSADRCGIGIRGQDALIDAHDGIMSGCGTGLQFHDTEAAVRGTKIQRNRLGLMSKRGSLLLQDVECADNELDGLQTTGTRLNLENNRLLRNAIGMLIEGGEGIVKGNRITGQRGNGVVLTNARVRFRDNLVTGNAGSGLVVRDGKGVAFANALHKNGQFDLLNEGQEEFRAPGNWWGGADPLVSKRIGGTGAVIVMPLLPQAPSEL